MRSAPSSELNAAFIEAVLPVFEFLTSELDCKALERSDHDVLFERSDFSFRLLLDGNQLVGSVKRNPTTGGRGMEVGFQEVLRCLGFDSDLETKRVRSKAELVEEARRLALQVRPALEQIVSGDTSVWEHVESCAKREVERWQQESAARTEAARVQALRAQVAEARARKHYDIEAQLLERLEDRLTAAERKRLELVRSKLSN